MGYFFGNTKTLDGGCGAQSCYLVSRMYSYGNDGTRVYTDHIRPTDPLSRRGGALAVRLLKERGRGRRTKGRAEGRGNPRQSERAGRVCNGEEGEWTHKRGSPGC